MVYSKQFVNVLASLRHSQESGNISNVTTGEQGEVLTKKQHYFKPQGG